MTQTSKIPQILILGGGAVTLELYLPALNYLGWLSQTTIADPSAAALEKLLAVAPQLRVQQLDYLSAIAQSSLDQAVVVALPNWLHAPACIAALEKGHHVLSEKPLALHADECEQLFQLSSQLNRVLMIGMVRRLTPAFHTLHSLLQSGIYGSITEVVFRDGSPFAWSSDTGVFFDPRAGGVLADMGVHFLDQLSCLLGELTPLSYSDDANGGVEANCNYKLQAQNAVPVTLQLSRTQTLPSKLEVHTEKAVLTMYKDNFDSIEICSRDGSQNWRAEAKSQPAFTDTSLKSGFLSCFAAQFQQFERAIGGDTNYVRADSAKAVIALIEWAYQQRQTHPKIALELPAILNRATVVTGATGFIGQALIQRFAEAGLSNILTLPVRSMRSLAPIARFKVNVQRTDLMDPAALKSLLSGQKHLVHLAVDRGSSEQAHNTIEGTRRLLEAAIDAELECVVLFSTLYTFGFPTGGTLDERAKRHPYGGIYAESKQKMLNYALERAKSSGKTRIVVLTPSYVYGPNGEAFTKLPVTLAKDGAFALFDQGQGLANYVYVDNVVDAILAALQIPQAHGEEFILNDGACTWREFLEPIFIALALELRELPLSALPASTPRIKMRDALFSMLKSAELRSWIKQSRLFPLFAPYLRAAKTRFQPAVTSRLENLRLQQSDNSNIPSWLPELFSPANTRFSSEKAKNLLNWQSRISLAEGQQRCIAWLTQIL